MNLPKIRSSKKKEKHYTNEGILESLGGIATGIKDSAVDELGKASVNDAWDMLLGGDSAEPSHDSHGSHSTSHGGDLSEGTDLNLAEIGEKAHEITEMGREFASNIIHAGERADAQDSQEIQIKMQEILIEIKKLSESSAELQEKVEVITVEQTAGNPGVYHLNFVEQMLSFIHELRMNVDDSLAWFGALRSKKAARQYGSMAKKHGTSFTLNNERQVATQVG
jgi:hypothetical protein